jgi:hypothetical protein
MSITGYKILVKNEFFGNIIGHEKRKVLDKWRKQGFIIKKICKRKQSKM